MPETQTCSDHRFVDYERRAMGYWEKRSCPGDGIFVRGTVQKCRSCLAMRLNPEDRALAIVELESTMPVTPPKYSGGL